MRGERRLLRLGEYLIARACRRLSAQTRDERYREWVAELPAILRDPDTRPAARRAARMLGYAAGTLWGTTVLAPGGTRRLMARLAGIAARAVIFGLVTYFEGLEKTPQEWGYAGIGFFLGSLTVSGIRFAYRRKRGKGLSNEPTEALARARPRVDRVLQPSAPAGPAISMARDTAARFCRARWRPGYQTAEVDEFIARIEATLTTGTRPGQPVTAADVEAATFGTTRLGGYDEQLVDQALDHYADALVKLGPFPPTTAVGD
jgi:DivIVA domain-containing protein